MGMPRHLRIALMRRARPRRPRALLALIGSLAAVLGACAGSPADAAELTILTGPARSAVAELFGPRLADALEVDVELRPTSGSWQNLEAIAADASLAGFAQRDLYESFVAERGLEGVLEHYGSIPVCLFGAARAGSPVTLGLGAQTSAGRLQTIDTGPTEGDTALTYQLLQERVPALADVQDEHRGWSRALARLAQGDLDLFVFMEYPSADAPLIADLFDNPRLVLLENLADVLGPIPLAEMAPYRATQASISRGWFDEGYVGQTLCTSLGVVIHRDGEPQLIEAVVHAATGGALLTDGGDSWWQSVAGQVGSLLDQGRRWTISFLNDL